MLWFDIKKKGTLLDDDCDSIFKYLLDVAMSLLL